MLRNITHKNRVNNLNKIKKNLLNTKRNAIKQVKDVEGESKQILGDIPDEERISHGVF